MRVEGSEAYNDINMFSLVTTSVVPCWEVTENRVFEEKRTLWILLSDGTRL